MTYRTLVLRRSPVASRPPSDLQDAVEGPLLPRSGSGRRRWPGALSNTSRWGTTPIRLGDLRAARSRDSAALAGSQGMVAAVARVARPVVVGLDRVERPPAWRAYGDAPGAVYPGVGGTAQTEVSLPRSARYGLWVKGAFHGRLEVAVDGRPAAAKRHDLSHSGQYVPLGETQLAAGPHAVTLHYEADDLHPGSGGRPFALGPLVFGRDTADRPVEVLGARAGPLALRPRARLGGGGALSRRWLAAYYSSSSSRAPGAFATASLALPGGSSSSSSSTSSSPSSCPYTSSMIGR